MTTAVLLHKPLNFCFTQRIVNKGSRLIHYQVVITLVSITTLWDGKKT